MDILKHLTAGNIYTWALGSKNHLFSSVIINTHTQKMLREPTCTSTDLGNLHIDAEIIEETNSGSFLGLNLPMVQVKFQAKEESWRHGKHKI